MDKETLSNYGWIVICILVLSVMIALSTPFGQYIKTAVENTTQGLFDVQQKAAGIAGLIIDDQKFNGTDGDSNSSEYDHNAPELHPTGVSTTQYEYGDYIYTAIDYGWYVSLNHNIPDYKTKTSYGPILESINGKPVHNISNLFQGCASLTEIPEIPLGVRFMGNTFEGCGSLTDADISNLVLPSGVQYIDGAFKNCTGLTDVSTLVIPNSVTDMSATFSGCTTLTSAPTIPSSVTNMRETFRGCTALTGTIVINATINTSKAQYYMYCFLGVDFKTQNLKITGTSSALAKLGGTGINYRK